MGFDALTADFGISGLLQGFTVFSAMLGCVVGASPTSSPTGTAASRVGITSPMSLTMFGHASDYAGAITVVPLGHAKDHLSEYVSEVARTHDRVTITRHGQPVAVLVSVDDMDGIEETLEILSTPGEYDAIHEGLQQAERAEYVDAEALQARHGFCLGD